MVTLKWPEETNFYGLHATRVKINLIIIKLESEIMIWKPNEMEQTSTGKGMNEGSREIEGCLGIMKSSNNR